MNRPARSWNAVLARDDAESTGEIRRNTGSTHASLALRFAAMPAIEADSAQWFGSGKAIDAETGNLQNATRDWVKAAFPEGMTVANKDKGWSVQVDPSGIKSTLSRSFGDPLARSVPFIPQIIEGGIHRAAFMSLPWEKTASCRIFLQTESGWMVRNRWQALYCGRMGTTTGFMIMN